MSYGLKVFSGNGTLQLDTNDNTRVLYQLVSTGTTEGILGATSDSWGAVSVTTTSPASSLLFVRPNATFNGQKVMGIKGVGGFTLFGPTNGVTYNWRIYQPTSDFTPSNSTYGLAVYNEGEVQIFTNNLAAVRLKASIEGTGTSATTGTLWGMPHYYIQRVTGGLTAATSGTYYYALIFNSNGSISQSIERAFRGAVVNEEDLPLRWTATDVPRTLILTT
jgi:hypothetical protein